MVNIVAYIKSRYFCKIFNFARGLIIAVGILLVPFMGVIIFRYILGFYFSATSVAGHSMQILNLSDEAIYIRWIRIDNIQLFYPKVSLKSTQDVISTSPKTQTSYIFQFESNQPEEIEIMINDPIVGESDFKMICKLKSKKRESCLWKVWYKKGQNINCVCESLEVPVAW
ncbi:MAG: hypothetical protein FWG97_04735 [Deltaproteobacteria bacterium]|nr:hypothetical protein [Deltaproteobacteria bacterium]